MQFNCISFVQEDYKLLENMNKVTMQKYASYRQIASDIGSQILELNEKCMLIIFLKFLMTFVYIKL